MPDIPDAAVEAACVVLFRYWTTFDEVWRDAMRQNVRAALAAYEAAMWCSDMEKAPRDTLLDLWWPHWRDVPVVGWRPSAGIWLSDAAISSEGPPPIAWRYRPAPPGAEP